MQDLSFSALPPLFDVRTPGEFQQDCIPSAQNIPLFDNVERAVIGTLYKQVGRAAAIDQGAALVEPRLQDLLEQFAPHRETPLVVYCARGGMRSGAVVRLLCAEGFAARQLEGGYKLYRQHVLAQIGEWRPPLIVLHGATGVGKTLILRRLPDHIDLEELAQHRSSLFGALGRVPSTQRRFEGWLHQAQARLPKKTLCFIEGESRKVGEVFIPQALAQAMQAGQKVLLTASLETRVARTLADYRIEDDATAHKVDQILQTLRMALGKPKVEHLRQCLQQGKLAELVAILLTDYYDPRYRNAMKHYHYAAEFSAEDLTQVTQQLLDFRAAQTASPG